MNQPFSRIVQAFRNSAVGITAGLCVTALEGCATDTSDLDSAPAAHVEPVAPASTTPTFDGSGSADLGTQISPDEHKKIVRFVERRQDPRAIVSSLRTSETETIDCVDARLQHDADHPIEKFEDPPSVAAPGAGSKAAKQLGQGYGTVTGLCPSGTIPRVRVSIGSVERSGSLAAYLSKSGDANVRSRAPWDTDPPPSISDHVYAAYHQYVTNSGAASLINFWQPTTHSGTNEFSISQIWVAGGSSTDDSLETVEAGWQKSPSRYGDSLSHIFIFYTGDNYGSNSCYNLDCTAFVQVNNSVAIGGYVPTSAQSVPGGFQQEQWFGLQQTTSGAWWWSYGGTWIGYWPAAKFDSAGIRWGAQHVSYGGEIVNTFPSGQYTTTQMGSGVAPAATAAASYGYSAYQRNLQYVVGASSPQIYDASGFQSVSNSSCYSAINGFQSGGGNRYIYFGGVGRSAACP